MRITSKVVGVGIAVAVTLALAGCVQPSATVVPTAAPSAKPVFKTDADALAAAKAAYLKYLAVSDQVLADGGKDPDRLLAVATRAQLKSQQSGFAEASSRGLHSTGETQIDQIALQGYFPTNRQAIVVVYACIDVSKVDVLDAKGKSVVSSDRPERTTFETTFDLAAGSRSKLLVAKEVPWEGASICS